MKTVKFLLDATLGKLAKRLRLLGIDASYYQGQDIHELVQLARRQDRVILTRNRRLLFLSTDVRIIPLFSDRAPDQVKTLFQDPKLLPSEALFFSRCLLCNALLDKISREEADGAVPDFIFHEQEIFYRCPQCRRIYWPGSHQRRMQNEIRDLLNSQGVKAPGGEAMTS